MPFVEVKSIEGVFDAKEKAEVIREITNVFALIKNEAFAAETWVVINELGSGDWGEGGAVLQSGDVPESSAAG